MKKILFVFATLASVIALCSCGGGLFSKAPPTPIPVVDPSTLITADDVAANTGYYPVLDGGAVKYDGNIATALYMSDPIGRDPVEIVVQQYNEEVPVVNVWYDYDTDRAYRTSAEEVADLGETAFIAFPSINIYDRGCYVRITAGSGADENQRNLLLTLANIAIPRLEEIMSPVSQADAGSAVEQK